MAAEDKQLTIPIFPCLPSFLNCVTVQKGERLHNIPNNFNT
jgi:hypothetical protein